MDHFNPAHLSVQQTQCGCPDAPVASLPASHLDSPGEETFDEIRYDMNLKACTNICDFDREKLEYTNIQVKVILNRL